MSELQKFSKGYLEKFHEPRLISGYSGKVCTDACFMMLEEIPSEDYRVTIKGYNEVLNLDDIENENDFYVDYTNNYIYFHKSKMGQTITVDDYYGIGLNFIGASRIIVRSNVTEDVIQTLEDLIEQAKLCLEAITTLGGAVEVIDALREDTQTARDVDKTLNDTINKGSATVQAIKDTGNKSFIINTTDWISNGTGYKYTLIHNLQSIDLHVSMIDLTDNMASPSQYKIININTIEIYSMEKNKANVVISARYYNGIGDNVGDKFIQEVADARNGMASLGDKIRDMDSQLVTKVEEINDTITEEVNKINSSLEDMTSENIAKFIDIDNKKATKQEVEIERNRINLLTKIESGETQGNTELLDIRNGENGEVYDTAGEAVRGQIQKLISYTMGKSALFVSNKGTINFNFIERKIIVPTGYIIVDRKWYFPSSFSVDMPSTSLTGPCFLHYNTQNNTFLSNHYSQLSSISDNRNIVLIASWYNDDSNSITCQSSYKVNGIKSSELGMTAKQAMYVSSDGIEFDFKNLKINFQADGYVVIDKTWYHPSNLSVVMPSKTGMCFLHFNTTTKEFLANQYSDVNILSSDDNIVLVATWINPKPDSISTASKYYAISSDVGNYSWVTNEFIIPNNIYMVKGIDYGINALNFNLNKFTCKDDVKFEIITPSKDNVFKDNVVLKSDLAINKYKTLLAGIYNDDYSNALLKDLTLYFSDPDTKVNKSPKILFIGDSITYAGLASSCNVWLKSFGFTPTFIGTRTEINEFGYGILDAYEMVKSEGMSGWRITDVTNTSVGVNGERLSKGSNNKFLNPETGKFDFSYFMSSNSFENVDFVVIGLGHNDLVGYPGVDQGYKVPTIEEILEYMPVEYLKIINSIKSFNPNVRIGLNPPIPCNSDDKNSKYFKFTKQLLTSFQNKYDNVDILSSYLSTGRLSGKAWDYNVTSIPTNQKNISGNIHDNGCSTLNNGLWTASWIVARSN